MESASHPWTLDPGEATLLQIRLRDRLVLAWDGPTVEAIGGIDASYAGSQVRAAIVVLRYPDLKQLATVTAEAPILFPYIPGLLAFREGPAVLAAWERLPFKPDLLLFDGQGIAHPRGFGIASHIGLWLDLPTIGVAKSRLYGHHATVGPKAGDQCELKDEDDPAYIIGAVCRTRENTNPLYISPGHRMDVEHAVMFTLACCRGYRLPEPIRLAHQAVSGTN